jgi:hypothetical protein
MGISRLWFIIAMLVVLCGATLFMVQTNKRFVQYVGNRYQQIFERSFNCTMTYAPVRVNLLVPSLEFADVTVKPRGSTAWSWRAKKYVTACSWWDLLLYGLIAMRVTVDNLQAESVMEHGYAPIIDHVRALFAGPATDMPLYLHAISLNHASCIFKDSNDGREAFLSWNCHAKRINNVMRVAIQTCDGYLKQHGVSQLEQLTGTLEIDVGDVGAMVDVTMRFNGACAVPLLPVEHPTCFFSGAWHGNQGTCTIKQSDNLFHADAVSIIKTAQGITIDGSLNTELAPIISFLVPKSASISGRCALKTHSTIAWNGAIAASGTCSFDKVQQASVPLSLSGAGAYARDAEGHWSYTGTVVPSGLVPLSVSGMFDEKTMTGHVHGSAAKKITVPVIDCTINPGQLQFDATLSADGSMSGSCTATVVNDVTKKQYSVDATGHSNRSHVQVDGHLHGYRFACSAGLQPTLNKLHAVVFDKDNKPLIVSDLLSLDSATVQSEIQLSCIRALLKQYVNFDLKGSGTCVVQAVLNAERPQVTLSMKDARIRVPNTYTIITGFSGTFIGDVARREITISNLDCSLQRGTVHCVDAQIGFTKTYALDYARLPLSINHCLLTVQKDLCALVSGDLVLQYDREKLPRVQGNFLIEHAQIHENLFSAAFQKQLTQIPTAFTGKGFDVACDLGITTKNLISVKTPFLDARASVAIRVGQTLCNPAVSGSITVRSGSLAFPYKSLYITKGSVMVMPGNLYDPLIELEAKNKIKKYAITMRATGSLQSPHVSFESVPTLTDEQIISLLLVGSEQASLNSVAPALFMNNITTLLFESGDTAKQLKQFMQLLTPFDRVRIVPSFADQTGRGGLRAGIEIDINDRWRALVQKNFNLTEDTRFELDYQLSDEVSLRAFRDERKDIGGEIEMRWKFGGP